MNEKLKSTLQLHWREPRRFFGWLTLFSLAALVVEFLVHQSWSHTGHGETLLRAALASAAVSLAAFALGFVCFVFAWIPPVRRLLAWLLQRRWFVLACLITLVALFYAEENWRGKRAWDHYRHAWEAKGEHFDFASVIPPPVPDDQNFALTPIVASTYLAELDGHGHRLNPGNTNVVDRLNISSYRANDSGDSNLVVGAWQKATITDLKPWQNYYRHPD